jgi:membrane fusion protein, multidrug efflux system
MGLDGLGMEARGRSRGIGLVLLLGTAPLLVLAACGRGSSQAESTPADEAQLITPENIVVVAQDTIESGPAISGSLTPARAAVIRAEVSGPVVQTVAEEGQSVSAGALLARIDDASLREAALSARSGVRSAEQAAQAARRNLERSDALAKAGAISERDLESARVNASSADAQLADATARRALAEKQLSNSQVRAPFAGIVADKPVSAGDVVSPGTALFTVVDPASMKLEAAVPASQVSAVRLGAPVQFVVQGYPGRVFAGRVQRINPAADPATRQVGVYVTIPNAGRSLVSGLYAEGRIGSERRGALVVPTLAVDLASTIPSVVRLKNGKVEKVDVTVGIRDEQNERIEIATGVAAGDTLLLGAAQGYSPGTIVRVRALDATTTQR